MTFIEAVEIAEQKRQEFVLAMWQLRQWRRKLESEDYVVVKLASGQIWFTECLVKSF